MRKRRLRKVKNFGLICPLGSQMMTQAVRSPFGHTDYVPTACKEMQMIGKDLPWSKVAPVAGIELAGITALLVTNRMIINYRKAKALGIVSKQKEAIDELAIKARSRYPQLTQAQAQALAKQELQRRYIESQDAAKAKARKEKMIQSGLRPIQEEREDTPYEYQRKLDKEILSETKNRYGTITRDNLFSVLRRRDKDASSQKIDHKIDELLRQ